MFCSGSETKAQDLDHGQWQDPRLAVVDGPSIDHKTAQRVFHCQETMKNYQISQ